MSEIRNIVIIGAGNVGSHLAIALKEKGFNIAQVVGYRELAVKELANATGAKYTLRFEDTLKGQDLYILALPDKVLNEILPRLKLNNELIVHTSGSVPMDILLPFSENTGVFYPLQTFTHSRVINLKEIPLLIEANRIDNENLMREVAEKLSDHVRVTDSVKRQQIHIAAVFASNFSNHMYNVARDLAESNGVDFGILASLIKETTAKAIELGPRKAQTGPAKRNDLQVIEKHLEMLSAKPEIQELYKLITQNIIDQNE